MKILKGDIDIKNPCEGCDVKDCEERDESFGEDGESSNCPAHIEYMGQQSILSQMVDVDFGKLRAYLSNRCGDSVALIEQFIQQQEEKDNGKRD